MKKLIGILALGMCFFASNAHAQSLTEFIKEGKPYIDLRLRYEYVEQDGLPEKAKAATARTRLGYQSGELYKWSGVLEVENVAEITDDYNNTVNGKTAYPTVADPENTEINQAYLKFAGIPDTAVTGGRQRIVLDDHRFIGDVGWRQNNQTFDAVVVANTGLPETSLKYGYIYNVNRIFGEKSSAGDWGSKSHFLHAENTHYPFAQLLAYAYLLDFGGDSPANSNQTYGLALKGKGDLNDAWGWQYRLEFARQSDYGDNTADYAANYYHIAPAVKYAGVTATLGYEVLGSDGGASGFRTPLATLHKFNGWADKFLTTPAAGLEDLYLDVSYTLNGLDGKCAFLNGLKATLQLHKFSAEDGGADFGNEWGVYLVQPLGEHMYAALKYADYSADDFSADTQKIILDLGFKY